MKPRVLKSRSMTKDSTPANPSLFHKLNSETGKINWSELQRHFARGTVVVVDPDLDLIRIAEQVSLDRDETIKSLLAEEKITRATDEHAIRWNEQNQNFWAVVVAPWVIVQEI